MTGSVVELLDDFLAAYPEDIWPTPPPERQAKDAAAAHVMRRLAYPVMQEARDEIERLRAALASVLNPPPWHELRHGPVDEWNAKASEYDATLAAARALLDSGGASK